MTPSLDLRTLLVMAGMLYLLVPMTTWWVLRMPRQQPALLWCLGGMIGGLGLGLMGLRGVVSDTVSYLIGQPLLALGCLMSAQGLRIDCGQPWRWRWILAAMAAYVGLLWAFLMDRDFQGLGVLIRAVNLCVILCLVQAAWRVGRREGSRNAMTIAGAYAVQALATLTVLVTALAGATDIQTMSGTVATAAAYTVVLLVPVVSAMGYLGLSIERSAREQMAWERLLSRARQWQARQEEIVRLDSRRLLAMMSESIGHEIAQPLTAAALELELSLRQGGEAPPTAWQQAMRIERVLASLHRAAATIDRVRDQLSPRSSGLVTVNLRDILRTLQRLVRQDAMARGVLTRFDMEGEAVTVRADPQRLTQALLQLVRNAMTAAQDGASPVVTVTLQVGQEDVRVEVTDSGPGYPPAVLSASAPSFPQAEPEAGLGLFVVKAIARLHAGELHLRNREPSGAVATLVLRLDPQPACAGEAARVRLA